MSDEQLPQSQMSATGQAHAIADPAPPSATTELRTLEVSEGSQLEPDQPADLNDSESHNGQELNVEAPAPSDGGESRTPAPEEPGADVVGHVSPASLSPLAEATNTDEPELEELYAIAGWNYSAQEENEISFQAGDIVRIVLRANTDWWEGINMSRQPATVGYFPANRVRLVAGKPDAPWDAPSSEPSLDAGPATNADDETKETIATTGDLPAAGIKEGLLNRLGGLNVTQPDLQPEEAGASERKGNETQKAESEVSEESLPESGEKVVEIDAEVEAEDPTVSAESAENLEDESELLDADGNPLPSHWRKLWHEDQQAFYYFNTETEETTWDVPGSNGTIEAELLSQDGQERLDSITASLPPDWEAIEDQSGSVYYYNRTTQETSWESPVVSADETLAPEIVAAPPRRRPSRATRGNQAVEFGTGTAPPPMPHRGHGKDDPPFRFLTFDAVPRGSILFAGPVYIRVQYGEDKRLDKDWTQFWACLVRGLLLVFSPGGSSQVKSFVACIDLHQLQARLATKEETKKKNALFIETAQKVGYLLRTDDEGEVMSWMATISAACVDGSAAEKELADQIRSFATLIDSQGEPVTKKDKISWKSMGGFLANLGGGGKPALADASPPAARKPFSDSQASLNQLPAPTTCFGGRLADQVANQQRPIPFLVETCIRQIEAHGILSEGIYRISGNAASVQRLKILFNTEDCPALSESDSTDVNALASLLKLYLRELQDPLIPYELYEDFVGAIRFPSRDLKLSKIKDLVQQLASSMPAHHDVLEYLVHHLSRVQEHAESNKMEAANLAIVFGPTILRSPSEQEGSLQVMNIPLQNELVELMVETSEWIFDGQSN